MQKTPPARAPAFAAAFLALCLIANPALAEGEARDSRITAVALPVYSLSETPKIEKLEFDFGADLPAVWLNRDGDFGVRSWVKHASLLCANYRVAVRFGAGAPGCMNVKWVSEPRFVTAHTQCNGARTLHLGGDSDTALAASIGQISCAERTVRCTGSCE
ncbi:MAG: hypothetical protein ACKVP2_10630 [Burkholderiales bacterium]